MRVYVLHYWTGRAGLAFIETAARKAHHFQEYTTEVT